MSWFSMGLQNRVFLLPLRFSSKLLGQESYLVTWVAKASSVVLVLKMEPAILRFFIPVIDAEMPISK